jgi:outer membrane autotransporter protein
MRACGSSQRRAASCSCSCHVLPARFATNRIRLRARADAKWGFMNNSFLSGVAAIATSLSLVVFISPARADLDDPRILGQLTAFEQHAALANQAVYDQLTFDPDGANGPLGPICDPLDRGGSGTCSGATFQIFENVRELVDTSNELLGQAAPFSLGLDIQNLGFALRWTAAEELAAQGSSATEFSNNQLNSLASRLSALRFGARGFRTTAIQSRDGSVLVAGQPTPLGGGAAADEESTARRWGGFIDGSFGYGRKDDTTFSSNSPGFEDAFDYDGQEITLGADYRFQNSLVVGAIVGYTDKSIDFDSRVSIVDGTIDADGYSVMFYGLWENERFFVSASLGGQWLGYDLVRRINYPSFNPLVLPVDETARSDTDSSTILATLGAGVDWRHGGFTLEPYLKAEYQKITIDGFTESGAHGFDFAIGEQDIKSLDTALGLRMNYVFTPSWGIIVPYLTGEFHKEFENDSRTINTAYSGLSGVQVPSGFDPNFGIPTDEPDDDYYLVSGGFSVVLKHGLQGFLQYQQVFSLDTFSDHAITGGIRLEF